MRLALGQRYLELLLLCVVCQGFWWGWWVVVRNACKIGPNLGIDIQHAMVAGGFGPYYPLWHGGTPTQHTCIISTTWTLPHVLDLDKI